MRPACKRFAENPLGHSFSALMGATVDQMISAGIADRSVGTGQEGWQRLIATPGGDEANRALHEAFFALLALGYVIPRPSNTPPDLAFVEVTDRGLEWAAGADSIPEDPSGYLDAFRAAIPEAPMVVMQYVQEAVETYDRRSYFAAAVMLGAASEATTYLLADAIAASKEPGEEKRRGKQHADDRRFERLFTWVFAAVERAKSRGMPYSVHQGADRHLASLQEAIRVARNEAGHPTAGLVDPLTVRLTLSAFPAACRKVHDLAEWFRREALGNGDVG